MSLPDQEKAIKEFYATLSPEMKEGRPLRILDHEKISAFRPGKRSIFKEGILYAADRGEIFGVLAAQSNRISRNPEENGAFSQRLIDSRITYFVAVADKRWYTGENSNDIFMFGVEGGMSWKDSKDKGTLILSRMEARAGEGKHMGRKPFGFKPHIELRADGSEIRSTVIDEERLHYAVSLYKMAATGAYSLKDLEKWAKKKNVKGRPTAKYPNGNLLNRTAIAHILHDPYYRGFVRFNGKIHQWTKDPPVDEALWQRVQLALLNRCTNTARVKVDSLRRRFVYGSSIRCGKCKGTLSPYKVDKKNGRLYVYYECKNQKTKCKVSIPQELLSEQYLITMVAASFKQPEVEPIRELLLKLHKEKSAERVTERDRLNTEYKEIERKITEQVASLSRAQALGVGKEAEAYLQELGEQRNKIQGQINENHDEGSTWVEKAIRSFELLKLTEEALKYGSPRVREAILKAIASNYAIIDGKLVCDLRSPFKEAFQRGDRPDWWAILDSNQ